MRMRPVSVWIGGLLLLIGLLLTMRSNFLVLAALYDRQTPLGSNPAFMLRMGIPLILTIAALGLIWAGRGWARFGFVALLAYAGWGLIRYFLNAQHFPFPGLLFVMFHWSLHVSLMGVALYFLFRSDARAWFAQCTALRIERRTGIPPEEQAGLPKRYWGAFAIGALVVGWSAYPVNLLAIERTNSMLGDMAAGPMIRLIFGIIPYSVVLLGVGTAVGWTFDTVRGANKPKSHVPQQDGV